MLQIKIKNKIQLYFDQSTQSSNISVYLFVVIDCSIEFRFDTMFWISLKLSIIRIFQLCIIKEVFTICLLRKFDILKQLYVFLRFFVRINTMYKRKAQKINFVNTSDFDNSISSEYLNWKEILELLIAKNSWQTSANRESSSNGSTVAQWPVWEHLRTTALNYIALV